MPLQNRISAFGDIVAQPARGQIMGNRGGRIHYHDKTLRKRRWASKAWIICVLEFKNRQREVMAPNSYTELFFLDEVTALAAGHRPCFECQRQRANEFAGIWGQLHGHPQRARAGEMDDQLHLERVANISTRHYPKQDASSLPDGTMVLWQGQPGALCGDDFLPWSFEGYGSPCPRPLVAVEVLTPASTLAVLNNGYIPLFHK